MDFETSGIEFEVKDEVKEEIIDEIIKELQKGSANANLELKVENGIDTEDLSRTPPLQTFALGLNTVETEFDVEQHIRKLISKPRVICPHCLIKFPTSQELANHALSQHTPDPDNHLEFRFRCVTCAGHNFVDQTSLHEHIKQYHISNVTVLLSRDRSLLESPHRPRLSSVQKDVNANVESQSEHTEPIEIDPLSSTTTPSGRTKTKLRILTTPPKCPHCPLTFSRHHDLQQHIINLHVKYKAFPCHMCASLDVDMSQVESFISQKSLNLHLRRCHGHIPEGEPPESRLKCPHCDKTYSRKGHLTYHIKDIHSGPRLRVRAQCSQCPLSFSLKQGLRRHLISCHQKPCENNDGEMESNCTTIHIKRPKGKRLRCLRCSLTLSSSDALKIHVMRVHERHTALPCLTCKSRKTSKFPVFATQEQLARHMRLYHDPASLQKCPRCDKGFTRRNLKYHILTKHLNIPRPDHKNHLRNPKYTLDNLLKEQIQEKQKELDSIVTEKKTRKTQIGGNNNCRYCTKVFLNTRELRDHIIQVHVKQRKTAVKEDLQSHVKEPKRDNGKKSEPENSTKSQCQPLPRVQCPKCSSTFSNSKHLQFHIMLLHVEKEEFPCLICTSRDQGSSNPEFGTEMKIQNVIFKDEKSLKQHMKNIHYSTHKQNLQEPEKVRILIPENKICPICSKSFDGKWAASNYRGHMQTHLDIKRYSCEHCSKKFATKMSLHMHLIRNHKYTREQLNLKYTCQLCPFITTSQYVLSYHVGRKHPYAGLQLDDQMNNMDLQTEPSLSHGNSRSNSAGRKNPLQSAVCFVCSKIQTSKCNLIQHLKEHRGEGRFYCDLCPRDYTVQISLMTHLKLDHHKLAYCNKCFTSFADVAALNQHKLHVDVPTLNSNQTIESQASENADSPRSNFKCEICGESSKSPCLLKIHTIPHLKEIQQQKSNFPDDEVVSADNIFKCSVCSKAFNRQSYLNAHLEIVHENPQESSRFQCDKCERNYKFVSELKYHDLVIHSLKINEQVNQNHSAAADGECGFECDICLTKFGTESELIGHQDSFSSQVLCHICPAKFKCNTFLGNHLKRVHKTDNYSHKHLCHICPSKFFNGRELRNHVERVHEGKYKRRRWYESAENNIDHQSETLRECNNSNNKVSDVLLSKKPETEPNLTPSHGRSRSNNKVKVTTKSVMCFVCSKTQTNKGNLMLHLQEHRGERRAYCDLCPRDFWDRFYLMLHLKSDHHKLANCNKCFTSFADKEALNQHLLHVDEATLNSNQTIESQDSENADPPKSNLKCEICGESSKSQCLFKIHSISHLKEMQQQELNFPDDEVVSVDNIFKCSLCPSAFDRQSYLNAHLNIVHESSPDSNRFECGKCERTYKTQNELKSHDLVVHSSKINQLCVINQNQNQNSDVSNDVELAFECSTCSSKFLSQSELTNHQDIFESKLSCHICSTEFKSKYNLKAHVRIVHGGKRFVCGICHVAKFSRGADLRKHVQRVHEGKNRKRRYHK